MADRIPADIWIGGKIAASLVPALCATILNEGVSLQWGDARFHPANADDLTDARVENAGGVPLLRLCDDEAAWGEFDELEEFLEEHKISFMQQSYGRYEHEPERIEFRPDIGRVSLATNRSGEAIVEAEKLAEVAVILTKAIPLVQAGQTNRVTTALRAATKKLQRVLPPAVPPLEPFEIVAARRKAAPAVEPAAGHGRRKTTSPRTRKDTPR